MEHLIAFLNIPNLLLGSLLGLAVWVLYSASRSQRFDPVDMLLDDRGKASSSRLAVFVALAVSTFMMVYFTTNKRVDDETLLYMFGAYIMTWAGSKTLEKGVEAWSSKGGSSRSQYDRYDQYNSYPEYSSPSQRSSRQRLYSDQPTFNGDPSNTQGSFDPIPRFTQTETPMKEDLSETKEGPNG